MDFIIAHQTGIAVYVLVHLLTYVLVIKVLSGAHVANQNNPNLEKYSAFKRNDLANWNIVTLFPFWLTFWPRAALFILNTITCAVCVTVFMTGVDVKNPELGPIRKSLLRSVIYVCSRFYCLLGGLYWIEYE